jgi:Uncharacterized conserved protein
MKRRLLKNKEDNDPMSVVGNLFDVAMVFAVALMVALVTRYNMTEMISQEDFTVVKTQAKRTWKSSPKRDKKSAVTRHLKSKMHKPERKAKKLASLTSLKMVKSFMFQNSKTQNKKIK